MGSINQFTKKLNAINIKVVAENALLDSVDTIGDIQRDQLLHGIKQDGKRIGKYRNATYAAGKFSQNALAGKGDVDLKLTGDFYRGIFVDVRPDTFVIFSQDEKANDLANRYGDPFGLTSKGKEKLIKDKLQGKFIKRIKEGLK